MIEILKYAACGLGVVYLLYRVLSLLLHKNPPYRDSVSPGPLPVRR